jgi:hypothetical protein
MCCGRWAWWWLPTPAAPPSRARSSAKTPRPARAWPHAQARWWWCWWWAKPHAPPIGGSTATNARPRRNWRSGRWSALPRSRVAAPTPRSRCPACLHPWAGATTTKTACAAASHCCTCWRAPAWAWSGWTTRAAARASAKACPRRRWSSSTHRACAAMAAAWTKPCWSACLNAWPKRLPASPAANCWCCTCWATTGLRTFAATRRL